MLLTRWSHRADFAVYPLMVAAAVSLGLTDATRVQAGAGLAATGAGWFRWTTRE